MLTVTQMLKGVWKPPILSLSIYIFSIMYNKCLLDICFNHLPQNIIMHDVWKPCWRIFLHSGVLNLNALLQMFPERDMFCLSVELIKSFWWLPSRQSHSNFFFSSQKWDNWAVKWVGWCIVQWNCTVLCQHRSSQMSACKHYFVLYKFANTALLLCLIWYKLTTTRSPRKA